MKSKQLIKNLFILKDKNLFAKQDERVLTTICKFINKGNQLSNKQLSLVRQRLEKYNKQLNKLNLKEKQLKIKTGRSIKLGIHNTIEISFPYNKETIARIKGIQGTWKSKQKIWVVPFTKQNLYKLEEWGFKIPKEHKPKQEPTELKEIEITGLKQELYSYQKKGVYFIEKNNGRALIADEMGLGKTAQALAYLQLHAELRPAIIIVPASIKLNWKKEINKWMSINKKTIILNGKKPHKLKPINGLYIINYDITANEYEKITNEMTGKTRKKELLKTGWIDYLIDIKPKAVIIDECHLIKNSQANRTKAIKKLKNTECLICLSGTPILNKPVELFNAVSLIDKKLFKSEWAFKQRYCGAKYNGFGWEFNGATNTLELNEILTNSIMVRRMKKDVLKQLPPKNRIIIPMEIDNRKEYKQAEIDLIEYIKETQGTKKANTAQQAEWLVRIEVLKQLAVKGKINQCINWIENFLQSDEKLVIFTTHTNTVKILEQHFKHTAVTLDGSTSQSNRQKAVDLFQQDKKTRLFIGNLQAAGVGITLTDASNTCFLELGWQSGAHDQAEDRVHRIGQEADSVNAYYLIAEKTIEEEICELLDKKRKIVTEVLDGVDQLEDKSLLTELLKQYRGK